MASRRVARVFDLVQYGVSIGLFGTFITGLGFMYLVHKERMDIATEYEKKIMAYREHVRTISDAEGLADDGTSRPVAPSAAVAEDTDGTRRIREASASMARANGRPLQAASPLERSADWTRLWRGARRVEEGDGRLKT